MTNDPTPSPVETTPADDPVGDADRDLASDPNLGDPDEDGSGTDWSSEGGATTSGPATHTDQH